MSNLLLNASEFRERFHEIGRARYHHRHPFHLLMHEGKLTKGQLQAWALNRYYYQSVIPIKDSIILSRAADLKFRQSWRKRILDHDGDPGRPNDAGGIRKWLKLTEMLGLQQDRVVDSREILPGTRFAVDAYVDWVSKRSFLEAIASSLTELFSRDLITVRLDALQRLYPFMKSKEEGLSYFQGRLTQAPEDAEFALSWVTEHARSRAEQELALGALMRKCDILWAQLDALYYAYVSPGFVPPGAFQPEAR
jgi:pyrroloquinoline-quinone synthase